MMFHKVGTTLILGNPNTNNLTFIESDQLDGPRTSIALEDFDTLDGLREHLGNEVITVEDDNASTST